jgi:hypothetical protein
MKLSDTQLVVLNTACRRVDRHVLPLPTNLKGGAAEKVIASLISKRLVEEAAAGAKDPVWSIAEDDQRLTLLLTDQAFETLGIEPEGSKAATGARRAASAKPGTAKARRSKKAASARPVPPEGKTRAGTKQASVIVMLRARNGATIAEIMAATGWLSHTVRGAIAGALKKKLGLKVSSEKVEGRGRVYKITD